MRNFKSFICFAMLFCTLLCVAACSRGKSNIDEVFSELEFASDNESDTHETAFVEHIYVIISESCSGELSLKARELADKIKEKTGLLTTLKYDNELKSAPKNACEILVGNTNRLASKNAIDILREDEYLCHWDNGAIVICGRSDDSTMLAADRFISEVVPSASKYSLMHSAAHFEYKCDYDIKNITIDGYDLYDYVFAYPAANKLCEADIAILLRNFINAKSGYFLDVIPDNEITSQMGRVIYLSAEQKENAIVPYEYGVALFGDSSYSLSLTVAKFIDDIKKNVKDGAVDIDYGKAVEVERVDTSFEAMFCFAKENEQKPIGPLESLMTLIGNEKTGICFIANPDEYLRDDIANCVLPPIKLREVVLGERVILIAYDENKIKQIDVAVADGEKQVSVSVETSFGEKLSFIYIIDGEISEAEANSVVFCENCANAQSDRLFFAVEGDETLSLGKVKCALLCDKNILLKNAIEIIRNDENIFAFTVKTELVLSDILLNDALK